MRHQLVVSGSDAARFWALLPAAVSQLARPVQCGECIQMF